MTPPLSEPLSPDLPFSFLMAITDSVSLSPENPRASLFLRKSTRDRLRILKKEMGFTSYDAFLNYASLELTKGAVIPPASYESVFWDSRPVILTGSSGSGKTTTIRNLLSQYQGNAFILDVSNEYPDFEKVDLGRLFGLKWNRAGQRIRQSTSTPLCRPHLPRRGR